MSFLYGERDRDIARWGKQVKGLIRKIKLNPNDEQEADLVDLDQMMKLYMLEYYEQRKKF